MTTALNLNMSLTMQGPTQCGKFETVNALAKLLGRLVIVFCCNQTTQIATYTSALQGSVSYFYNLTMVLDIISYALQLLLKWERLESSEII
jgi:midasin (ATPase involved in ribosome maturation)